MVNWLLVALVSMSGLSRIILINNNSSISACLQTHLDQLLPLVSNNLHNFPSVKILSLSIDDFIRNEPSSPSKSVSLVASPGNSLSLMGGGFDKYLLQALSLTHSTPPSSPIDYKILESSIHKYSMNKYNGYIPSKTANLIDLPSVLTDFDYKSSVAYQNHKIEKLLSLPTMIVPESIPIFDPSLVFDSIWNILCTIKQYNQENKCSTINTLILPGFGTGYGQLNIQQSTKLMVAAITFFHLKFDKISKNNKIPDELGNDLGKSILILFLLNKNYLNFENSYDINNLSSVGISKYGLERAKSFNNHTNLTGLMDWQELIRCVDYL